MERMLRSRLRAILPIVCLLATLAITGCEVKQVKLQLPTFFSAGVTEIWFWRLDDTSNEYVRSGHLRLKGLSGPPGRKVLHYTMVAPDGVKALPLIAPVQVRGDSIIVQLDYSRWQEPGWFRVSARNGSGESGLSDDEIFL
jgi:hypothetical protein